VVSFIIAGKNTLSTFGWGAGAELGAQKHLYHEGVVYVVSQGQNPQSGH
jgi:hypothetical protein